MIRDLASPLVLLALAALGAAACDSTPPESQDPAWADVAPILRGQCNGCHGWNAGQTGGGYRFDFFDLTQKDCGDAAHALDKSPAALAGALAPNGSPLVAPLIESDVAALKGQMWPRMPPQPCPALPAWERDTLQRWAALPVKGLAPPGNRPPTIAVYGFPAVADSQLTFTAIIDDPDGDSAVGVVEANGLAFLMNRSGSFDVTFDSSSWPAGSLTLTAVLCDGWTSASVDNLTVQIQH
jgi:hypothetical protein